MKLALFCVTFVAAAFSMNMLQLPVADAHVVPQNEVQIACKAITGSYSRFPTGSFVLSATVTVDNGKPVVQQQTHSGPSGSFSFDISKQTAHIGVKQTVIDGNITWTADGGGTTHFHAVRMCGTPIEYPSVIATTVPVCAPAFPVISLFAGNGNTTVNAEIFPKGAKAPVATIPMAPNSKASYTLMTTVSTTVEVIANGQSQVVQVIVKPENVCHPVPPTISKSWTPTCTGADITITSLGGNVVSNVILKSGVNGVLFSGTMGDANAVMRHDPLPYDGKDNVTIKKDGKIVFVFEVHAKSKAQCVKPKPPVKTTTTTSTTVPPAIPVHQQQPPKQLPFTGAGDVVFLLILGISAVSGGFWLSRRNRGDHHGYKMPS